MRLVVRSCFAVFALATLGLSALACSDSTAPNQASVQVQNNSFDPTTATISAGGTVTWQWASGAAQHNVTWVNQSGTSNSPTQATGTYTRNFSTAGTYDYFCSLHGSATGGMRGSVVVQ